MNVSLHQPKADDFEVCASHLFNISLQNDKWKTKLDFENHKIKVNKASEMYKKDSEEKETEQVRYYSMDLQKVILIPYKPNIKASYFLSRLIVFD